MVKERDFSRKRASKNQKIGIINLGCARNLVDSQHILGRLKKRGHEIVNVSQADTVILNTCSFIEDARRESVDAILDMIELKKQGKIAKVIVAGCLSERYGATLVSEFKEIDAVVGIQSLLKEEAAEQFSLTPKHFSYVKICESCYNHCSFCAIPNIKGKFTSRTFDSIINEIKALDESGVKEINIIGQDITAYGIDLYGKKSLAELLKEVLGVIKNIEWVRLLYAFPAHITDELLDIIASDERICNYIDVPLQHISDNLLKSMNRRITKNQTQELIGKIRKMIPGALLRTAFIVGLPGETEENFNELIGFIEEEKFEKVGAFIYSREEDTPAHDLPDQVLEKVKGRRLDTLMRIQQGISVRALQKFVGQNLKVLIEEKDNETDNVYLGRTQYDAPDVDGLIYVHSKKDLPAGDFAQVLVTGSLEYDLIGEVS